MKVIPEIVSQLSTYSEPEQRRILDGLRALNRTAAHPTLVDRRSDYSEAEQEQILAAVEALTGSKEKER